MKKQIIAVLSLVLMLGIFSIASQAQTHSVWTNNNGAVVFDAITGCQYDSLASFNMATSWTESSPAAYAAVAHFRGVTKAFGFTRPCQDHSYEFVLLKTAGTDNDTIKGAWDVYRDSTLVCSACDGVAYGLSLGVGNYYKVYVDDPVYGAQTWLYSGFIDTRKDF